MHTYHLSPRFFNQLKQRLLLIFGPLLLAIAGFVIWMVARQSGDLGPAPQILSAAVVLAVMGGALWNAYRVQLRAWSTFRITLNGDTLTRSQINLPTLAVSRSEITAIEEAGGAGLVVRTLDPAHQLAIPAALDGYAELRAVLASWLPIEAKAGGLAGSGMFLGLFGGLAALGACGIVFFAANPPLVLAVGALLIAALLASMVLMRRSPHIDQRGKDAAWLVLLPILSIVIRMVTVGAQWLSQ